MLTLRSDLDTEKTLAKGQWRCTPVVCSSDQEYAAYLTGDGTNVSSERLTTQPSASLVTPYSTPADPASQPQQRDCFHLQPTPSQARPPPNLGHILPLARSSACHCPSLPPSHFHLPLDQSADITSAPPLVNSTDMVSREHRPRRQRLPYPLLYGGLPSWELSSLN